MLLRLDEDVRKEEPDYAPAVYVPLSALAWNDRAMEQVREYINKHVHHDNISICDKLLADARDSNQDEQEPITKKVLRKKANTQPAQKKPNLQELLMG